MSWKRIGPTLKRLRREIYPACATINDFVGILNGNIEIKEMFGQYRGDEFYRESIIVDDDVIVIFGVQQLINEIPLNCSLYGDGTFGIVPLNFQQLYIVMADIAGRLSSTMFFI